MITRNNDFLTFVIIWLGSSYRSSYWDRRIPAQTRELASYFTTKLWLEPENNYWLLYQFVISGISNFPAWGAWNCTRHGILWVCPPRKAFHTDLLVLLRCFCSFLESYKPQGWFRDSVKSVEEFHVHTSLRKEGNCLWVFGKRSDWFWVRGIEGIKCWEDDGTRKVTWLACQDDGFGIYVGTPLARSSSLLDSRLNLPIMIDVQLLRLFPLWICRRECGGVARFSCLHFGCEDICISYSNDW